MAVHLSARLGRFMGALVLMIGAALPPAAFAQDDPRPGQLIAVLTGDWNNDGAPDAAVVQRGSDDVAGLLVLTGDAVYGLQPYADIPDLVFAGPMGGQVPRLSVRSDSSFTLHSGNTGIGRSAWAQDITIAWRQGGFVVAGFTYTSYDRLNVDAGGSCDVNLLSGGYELTLARTADKVQRGTGTDRTFPLSALGAGYAPAICAPLVGG